MSPPRHLRYRLNFSIMRLSDPRSFSLEQKIGQLLFIGIPGPEVDEETRHLISAFRPGGYCLFARNIRSPEQVRQLLDQLRDETEISPFLSVDQEGGLVDRLRRIMAPMPSASKLRTAADAREIAGVIAASLSVLGFNMDFAPVVDVIGPDRGSFVNGLHTRNYGGSAKEVAEFAGEFLRVLQEGGIIGCIKHFPGLGASEVDSHEELPLVSISEDEFEAVDLLPYRTLIGTGLPRAVMIAHAAYPDLRLQEIGPSGKLLPSSLGSGFVTKLLREQIGFDGLVLTDDLEMGAIVKNYGIGEAAVLAILAGNDMACVCAGRSSIEDAHAALARATAEGRLTEERIDVSFERIMRLKDTIPPSPEFDGSVIVSLTERIGDLGERLV